MELAETERGYNGYLFPTFGKTFSACSRRVSDKILYN